MKKYEFDGHKLFLMEDHEPEEATQRFWTMTTPDGKEQTVDFTSHEIMTEQTFKYIVALKNPQRIGCSPWNNNSLKEFYNKNM